MSPQIRLLLFASAWVGTHVRGLALERIPGDYAHAYCGAWGCLPPLQALAAMHGFWLMMMIPPTAWLVARNVTSTAMVGGGARVLDRDLRTGRGGQQRTDELA